MWEESGICRAETSESVCNEEGNAIIKSRALSVCQFLFKLNVCTVSWLEASFRVNFTNVFQVLVTEWEREAQPSPG